MYHGSGYSQGYESPACNPWKPSHRTAFHYRIPASEGSAFPTEAPGGSRRFTAESRTGGPVV